MKPKAMVYLVLKKTRAVGVHLIVLLFVPSLLIFMDLYNIYVMYVLYVHLLPTLVTAVVLVLIGGICLYVCRYTRWSNDRVYLSLSLFLFLCEMTL